MSRTLAGLAVLFLLVIIVTGCDLAAGAQGVIDETTPTNAARNDPATTPTPPPVRVADLVGSDGRLTVLVLGSDQRDGVIGTRTDAIIVATIDPTRGKVAMVSLPRDTINVPIAPGVTYPGRINSLFWEYERETGKTKKALRKFKDALAYAFGTEIDYYALVHFDGLVRLVNSIGGIKVTLKESLVDPTMHIGKKGLRLKAGVRQLDGRKTLAFSRTRHADSDYGRSRRQQQVLVAATSKVRNRGAGPLPNLVAIARKKITTDLPLEGAPALLELATKANLKKVKSIVLEPGRFARIVPGTYTTTLSVIEVQKMFAKVFRPVG